MTPRLAISVYFIGNPNTKSTDGRLLRSFEAWQVSRLMRDEMRPLTLPDGDHVVGEEGERDAVNRRLLKSTAGLWSILNAQVKGKPPV